MDFSSLLDAIESADPFQSEILARQVAAIENSDESARGPESLQQAVDSAIRTVLAEQQPESIISELEKNTTDEKRADAMIPERATHLARNSLTLYLTTVVQSALDQWSQFDKLLGTMVKEHERITRLAPEVQTLVDQQSQFEKLVEAAVGEQERLQRLAPEVETLVEQQNHFERLVEAMVREQERLQRLTPDMEKLLEQRRELAGLIEAALKKEEPPTGG
jgi:hypothetical protein